MATDPNVCTHTSPIRRGRITQSARARPNGPCVIWTRSACSAPPTPVSARCRPRSRRSTNAKATLGTGPNEGYVYTVAGSSGQISGGTLNHPVMVRSLNVLGSVVIDVDGPRLDARFLDSQGAVRDSFTVLKPPLTVVHDEPARAVPGLRILSANPARGAVRFGYRLESAQRPRLVILDAAGRRVRVSGAGSLGAGEHEVVWDGRDDRELACVAGVYFAVLEAGDRAGARKVIRLGP